MNPSISSTATKWALICALVAWSAVPAGAWAGGPVDGISLETPKGETRPVAGTGERALIVDVWATWCRPCLDALPRIDALARELGPRGVRVVAVSQDEDADTVAPFVKRLGLRHLEVLVDSDHKVAEALQPPTMPTTFILDASGAVKATFPAWHEGDEEKLRAATLDVLARDTGELVTKVEKAMGTRVQIRAYVKTSEQRKAIDAAMARIHALERELSPWIEASDLSRMNAAAGGEPLAVGPGTFALVKRSLALCAATGRAFDPTFFALKPLYDLRAEPFVPPAPEAVQAALPLVDCRKIELDETARTARLAEAGMKIHLGGNAKGTSLDEAAAILTSAGISRFVVDGGGDIVASGDGPKGPWRVGIQHPRSAERGAILGVLRMRAGAVATSGDYERFKLVNGERYHHIVDPRLGIPARGCMSSTVLVPPGPHAGETADAWATTLCVLGAAEGLPLLQKEVPGAEASVHAPDGSVKASSGFPTKLPKIE